MKIVVLGTGYVGLVSGVCFANWGHEVICVDKNASKVKQLKRGEAPFFEPGLSEMITTSASQGKISFATSLSGHAQGATLIFVAVGTPPSPIDGSADLGQIFAAAEEIAHVADPGTVVVMKSTVPVGTGDRVAALIAAIRGHDDVAVISNPEFLREGCAIADFLKPDRVVVGTENAEARRLMLEAYQPLVKAKVPFVFTQRRSSELIKYASNSFLAAKIAFINQMSDLCEKVGADIADLALGMGLDARIGPAFLNVGPGYGGSCFPKDTLALLKAADEHGVDLGLVHETVKANQARKAQLATRVAAFTGVDLKGKTVAVLGLAFKANTDDLRESPALALIEGLEAMGARVQAYDPAAMKLAAAAVPGLKLCGDLYACARGADVAVVATEWAEFRQIDFARLRQAMSGAHIMDLRNIIDVTSARHNGFEVATLGKAPASQRAARPQGEMHSNQGAPQGTMSHV